MHEKDLEKLNTDELIEIYSKIIELLKKRNVIRSKNLIGDIGEYLVISHFNNTGGLPNLARAPVGTKNIDAISREGERYSIKATSTTATGTFWGLNPPNSENEDQQRFEYVIVAIFYDNYKLKKIVRINWKQFLELKRWHKTMNAWNIPVNSKLDKVGTVIFSQ